MNTAPTNQDPWDACLPGELHRMVVRVKTRRRRRFLKQLGGAAAAVFVVGAGAYVTGRWLRRPTEYHFGGIACREVKRQVSDYRAKRLAPGLMRRISIHLRECPLCGPAYRRMTAEVASA